MLVFLSPRPWTSHSRTTSRGSSTSRRTGMVTGSGLLATLPLVVLLVLPPCFSCTPLTMRGQGWPMMPRQPREEVKGNSMVLSMSTARHSSLMVLLGFTVDLTSLVLESSYTVVCTLGCTILSSQLSSPAASRFVWTSVSSSVLCCFAIWVYSAVSVIWD